MGVLESQPHGGRPGKIFRYRQVWRKIHALIFANNKRRQDELCDKINKPKGVIGHVQILNSKDISTQPIVSFDWNHQKLGLGVMASLDQTIRVTIITKLNLY